jgi:hypothetical protein
VQQHGHTGGRDPSYRERAGRLRAEFRALPGPEHGVVLPERLARVVQESEDVVEGRRACPEKRDPGFRER